MQGDRVGNRIIRLLAQANAPLETAEIVEKIARSAQTTRTIVFKRLIDLRGDQAIRGKCVGSGKGAWVWWSVDCFATPALALPTTNDAVADAVTNAIQASAAPLETTEVAETVRNAIPATRTVLVKRLRDLRDDGAILGRQIGSGKGTWIWWRAHAQ